MCAQNIYRPPSQLRRTFFSFNLSFISLFSRRFSLPWCFAQNLLFSVISFMFFLLFSFLDALIFDLWRNFNIFFIGLFIIITHMTLYVWCCHAAQLVRQFVDLFSSLNVKKRRRISLDFNQLYGLMVICVRCQCAECVYVLFLIGVRFSLRSDKMSRSNILKYVIKINFSLFNVSAQKIRFDDTHCYSHNARLFYWFFVCFISILIFFSPHLRTHSFLKIIKLL